MTSRRQNLRRNCLGFSVFLIMLLLALAVTLVAGGMLILPGYAEQTFGPPSNRLSSVQRVSYSGLLIVQAGDLTKPADPSGQIYPFRVEHGESIASITRRLWQDGFISNPSAFRTYLLYSGLDTSIQAGNYTLSAAMTPVEIAEAMQDATPSEITFRVLAGWRLEEVAEGLPTSGFNITPEAFLSAVRSRPEGYSFSSELPEPPSLEGFLFPDAYTLPREATADDLLKAMIDNFETHLTPEIRNGFSRQDLTLYEAVTLASIVQREAMLESDMPLIASVFLNRSKINMKLDSDPTVQYAIGWNPTQKTWWTNPLSLADLKVESPYNTYIYKGYPPGPIGNPSKSALWAVAFPAQTPYFYFRAGCDNTGRHLFAETFEQHLNNACP
jgi:UPF0755 protein